MRRRRSRRSPAVIVLGILVTLIAVLALVLVTNALAAPAPVLQQK